MLKLFCFRLHAYCFLLLEMSLDLVMRESHLWLNHFFKQLHSHLSHHYLHAWFFCSFSLFFALLESWNLLKIHSFLCSRILESFAELPNLQFCIKHKFLLLAIYFLDPMVPFSFLVERIQDFLFMQLNKIRN